MWEHVKTKQLRRLSVIEHIGRGIVKIWTTGINVQFETFLVELHLIRFFVSITFKSELWVFFYIINKN